MTGDHPWGDHAVAALVVLTLFGSGCSGQQAVGRETSGSGPVSGIRVTAVALGDQVGLDKRVGQPMEVFEPEDTIYVSVVTEGTSSSTRLGARWMRNGRVLEETSQYIAPSGAATSEFHVSKPGGFERGEYEVEVLVEGRTVERRRFTVR
jgi:hypothetical protein